MAENESEEVELISFLDDSGRMVKLKRYRGRLWSWKYSDEAIKGVGTFKARDDDVIVVTYPKSGSHWLTEIVSLLLAGPEEVHNQNYQAVLIDITVPEKLEEMPSPRVLNMHAHFEQISRDIIHNKHCKLVYVTRDPRDVAVSFFHFMCHFGYDGEWKDFFQLFLSGQMVYETWFEHSQGWEKGIKDNPDLPVHVSTYEAHKENPIKEIEKLALFLGASTDKSFLEEVVKKTSFDTMKTHKMKIAPPEFITKEGKHAMYRKGKTGEWKNTFTVAQAEQLDAVFEKEMKGTNVYELYTNQRDSPGTGAQHSDK